MKKTALFKTSVREILNSPTRFLSILGIIFLGVAFFVGIGATGPDMLQSADNFYQQKQLADATVVSTLGLSDQDVAAIKDDHLVAKVEPQYLLDLNLSKKNLVVRFLGLNKTQQLNQYKVIKGRLPEKSGEVALDNLANTHGDYKIGDKLTLAKEDDPDEQLVVKELKIVGFVNSPEFIENVKRGNTNVGSGAIDYFAVVPEGDFNLSAYSRILVTFAGTQKATAYTANYDKAQSAGMTSLKKSLAKRPELRLEEVKKTAESELAKVQKQLTDGQKELDQAESQLKAAKKQIDEGKKTFAEKKKTAEEQLAAAKEKLANEQAELQKQQATLDSKQKELDQQQQALPENIKKAQEAATKLEETIAEQEKANQALATLEGQWQNLQKVSSEDLSNQVKSQSSKWQQVLASLPAADDLEADLVSLLQRPSKEQLTQLLASTANLSEKYQQTKAELDNQAQQLKATSDESAAQEKINQGQREINQNQETINAAQEKINQAKTELDKKTADTQTELTQAEKKLKDSETAYEQNFKEYQTKTGESMPKLTSAKQKIETEQKRLADMAVPEYIYGDREDFPGYVEYQQNADRVSSLATVFPIIFFLIAALVSLTTMTRMVEEKRTEIGTFKALGYKNGEIAQKFLLYSALAGVLGSVLGLALGFYVFPTIIINAYGQLYSIKDFVTPWYWHYSLIGLGVGLLCTVVVAMLALRLDLFSSPATLLRPKAPKAGKRVLLEYVKPLWKRLSFIQKVTMRNLFRYKLRMFMTIFGIAGCTSMIVTGFGIRDSVTDIVPLQFEKLWHYQAIVTLNDEEAQAERTKYQEQVQHLNRYQESLPIGMETLTLSGSGETPQDVSVYVPKDSQNLSDFILLNNRETNYQYQLNDKGAIVDEKLAQLFDLSVGDTVKLKDANGKRYPIKIVAIAENYTGHFAYVSPKYYQAVFGKEPKYNAEFLLFDKDLTSKQEKAVAEELMENQEVVNVTFLSDQLNALDDTTQTLNLVVWVLIISAGLLALIVLYNLNNINISERIRELSTIKVLGFYNNEVTMYIYRENILLTIIGIGLGLLLGIIEHRYVLKTVEMDILMFSPNIHWLSFVYASLITIFFTIVVGIVIYFKLKKVDMIEALKSNE